jgi:tetratricopeptide (TPR) repeat protein
LLLGEITATEIRQILSSLLPLADANPRVRRYVYQALENQVGSSCHLCSQNAVYQLAMCHQIGFGSKVDRILAEKLLEESGRPVGLFHKDVEFITHTQETRSHHNTALSTLWNTGHFLLMDPTSRHKNRHDLDQERRSCITDIENASLGLSESHSFVFTLRNSLVTIQVGLGNFRDAYGLCESLTNKLMQDPRYGPSSVATWTQVSALAAIQYLRGKYAEAAELQQKVLDKLSALKGERDMFTLSAMADLSLTYYGQDKMGEAKSLLLRVLDGIRSNLGEAHPSTLVIENDLASIFYQQGDLEEAEKLFRKTLIAKKRTHGIGNRSTLATMGNLALITRYRGNLAESEALNRQALKVREDILFPGHPDILTNLGNLAAVLQARGKLEEAESVAQKCLENTEKALGTDHPETFTSMHNLASILQDRAKFSDALKLYLKARECKERHPSLGTNHARTMDTISCLAILYTELGMFAEALDCDQRVLDAISTKPGGEHSVLYLSTKRHLGTIYHKLGKYKEAEEHIFCAYQEQLQAHELTLSTLATMQAYASISADLGRKTDALELYHQVLAGREAKLGPKHQRVLDTVDALGELYCALGQYEEAEKYSRRAFNGLRELFKAPHPDLLMSASNLSMVLIASAHQDGMISNIPAEAEGLAEMALEGSKQLLGPKHPTTVHMLWRMGILKSHQKEVLLPPCPPGELGA